MEFIFYNFIWFFFPPRYFRIFFAFANLILENPNHFDFADFSILNTLIWRNLFSRNFRTVFFFCLFVCLFFVSIFRIFLLQFVAMKGSFVAVLTNNTRRKRTPATRPSWKSTTPTSAPAPVMAVTDLKPSKSPWSPSSAPPSWPLCSNR